VDTTKKDGRRSARAVLLASGADLTPKSIGPVSTEFVAAVRGVRLLPAYMGVPAWVEYSGTGRTVAYAHITSGRIRSILVGRRRLVDVESGLEFLASLAVVEGSGGCTAEPDEKAIEHNGGPSMKRGRGRPRKTTAVFGGPANAES
jgi:hypothetical protein